MAVSQLRTRSDPPLLAIDRAPLHAVELRPSTLGMSFTGLRIDEDARVLDASGVPVGGLYAAGETTGGLQGVRNVGSGAGGNALVFGKRAGRTAATAHALPGAES